MDFQCPCSLTSCTSPPRVISQGAEAPRPGPLFCGTSIRALHPSNPLSRISTLRQLRLPHSHPSGSLPSPSPWQHLCKPRAVGGAAAQPGARAGAACAGPHRPYHRHLLAARPHARGKPRTASLRILQASRWTVLLLWERRAVGSLQGSSSSAHARAGQACAAAPSPLLYLCPCSPPCRATNPGYGISSCSLPPCSLFLPGMLPRGAAPLRSRRQPTVCLLLASPILPALCLRSPHRCPRPQARLQVELASLNYAASRLVRTVDAATGRRTAFGLDGGTEVVSARERGRSGSSAGEGRGVVMGSIGGPGGGVSGCWAAGLQGGFRSVSVRRCRAAHGWPREDP